jgi:hypothetical protein
MIRLMIGDLAAVVLLARNEPLAMHDQPIKRSQKILINFTVIIKMKDR